MECEGDGSAEQPKKMRCPKTLGNEERVLFGGRLKGKLPMPFNKFGWVNESS